MNLSKYKGCNHLISLQALANMVTQEDLDVGRVYPPLSTIRDVSTGIATYLVELCVPEGNSW